MYMHTYITYMYVYMCVWVYMCVYTHCYVYNTYTNIHKLKRTQNIDIEHVITCLISVTGHMAVTDLYN